MTRYLSVFRMFVGVGATLAVAAACDELPQGTKNWSTFSDDTPTTETTPDGAEVCTYAWDIPWNTGNIIAACVYGSGPGLPVGAALEFPCDLSAALYDGSVAPAVLDAGYTAYDESDGGFLDEFATGYTMCDGDRATGYDTIPGEGAGDWTMTFTPPEGYHCDDYLAEEYTHQYLYLDDFVGALPDQLCPFEIQ